MGSVWSRLGTEVHVIEFLDHITWTSVPSLDHTEPISKPI
jgi:pyruvate/2-oxoglutarate dehydrogenase complex dihydrolipoamide dehydrogenase (E3) component